MQNRDEIVVLGHVSGVYGVRGWLKISSGTEDPESIFDYSCWLLRPRDNPHAAWAEYQLVSARTHGNGLVAQLAGITDRDKAKLLVSNQIAILKEQLPPAAENEYYWSDLIGMTVHTTHQVLLGRVKSLMETGAHDVLVIKGDSEHLIPFVQGDVVTSINVAEKSMTVNWDPDF